MHREMTWSALRQFPGADTMVADEVGECNGDDDVWSLPLNVKCMAIFFLSHARAHAKNQRGKSGLALSTPTKMEQSGV